MLKEAIMAVLAGLGGFVLVFMGLFIFGFSYGNIFSQALGAIFAFFGVVLCLIAKKLSN
jgi:hypothetical protein